MKRVPGNGCQAPVHGAEHPGPANNTVLSGSTDGGVDGGGVEMVAELVADSRYASTTQFPPMLNFVPSRGDGSSEVGSFGAQLRTDGTYRALWTPPMAQAQITLSASHPATESGLTSSVSVTVDSVPPTFTFSVPAAPTRSAGSSAMQADQRDTSVGFDAAYRRDETITVTVSANEPVVNVALTITGIGSSGPGAVQPLTLQPATTCGGSPPFCQSATLDFSTPEMVAFRGTMTLRVTGQDAAGNMASATQSLAVTRWKWAFDAAGNILGTPAIGARGAVYFGTSAVGPTGRAFAVDPEGNKKWDLPTGEVLGSVAVGDFSGGEEFVYVAAKSGNTPTFYAFNGVAGTEARKCTYNGTNELPGSIAIGTTTGTLGATLETAFTVYNGTTVRGVKLRPSAVIAVDDECPDFTGVLPTFTGSSMVLSGTNVFYGTNDFRITSYDFAPASGNARAGWPQNTNDFTRAIAVVVDKVYGAASDTDSPLEGNFFTSPVAGASISSVYPAGAANSRVFNFAIAPNNIAYFGAESGLTTKELLALPLDVQNPQITRASMGVGTLRGAPVLGKNDRLYTLNDAGRVSAWTASTLAFQWNVDIPSVLMNSFVSPTLDCRRNTTGQPTTGPGTLYIAGASRLYAFIVDSPGLATAPWPKFQHDARNTGNPATPVTNCP